MKRRSYWIRHEQRARRALKTGEWWDGRRWRPHGELPRTRAEANRYRSAHDRLDEILAAMVGGDDRAQITKASRFAQSARALKKNDGERRKDVDYVWDVLKARFGERRLLNNSLGKTLLAECCEELARGHIKTRKREHWTLEGVKSFLRRRRL